VSTATLYYNPKCSKCRGALELLEARDLDLTIVNYIDAPPDRDSVVAFIKSSDSAPAEFLRSNDKAFLDAGLSVSDSPSAEEIADLIVRCPRAMQRPVLVVGAKAVIGRPSDRVLELLAAE
jgi:arsenate reductase